MKIEFLLNNSCNIFNSKYKFKILRFIRLTKLSNKSLLHCSRNASLLYNIFIIKYVILNKPILRGDLLFTAKYYY